jgi:hypothetical protein
MLALLFILDVTVGLSLNAFVLRYYRKKNVEWRDDIQESIIQISSKLNVLTNNVNNNIRSNLIRILYEELKGYTDETRLDRSFKFYLESRISDFSLAYNELKDTGIQNINKPSFTSFIKGRTSSEYLYINIDFPLFFCNNIDVINEKAYSDFKDSVSLQFNLNTTDDRIAIIKTIIKEIFRINVYSLYNYYKNFKATIKIDEVSNPEILAIKKLNIADKIEINPEFLKSLISQGTKGMERAINLIQLSVTDKDKLNDITLFSSRFQDYAHKESLNMITDDNELNNIRYYLLNFIDKL